MLDILIKNGKVIDGSGKAGVMADVGIRAGRIEAVEALPGAEADLVIDARGLVVAPGFIDIHSHADYTLPVNRTADSKVYQGVTTEVVGNCGISMAPLTSQMQARKEENMIFGDFGLVWEWDSFESFLDLLRQGTSVNVIPLVGHGTVRRAVMQVSDERPTPAQMEAMRQEVRAAMRAGAFGLSTGLIYAPNVYAETDEIIELAKIAAAEGGIYTSHIRGEGNTVLEAVDEAIEVGRRANIPVEISHLKAEQRINWHKMTAIIEKIDAARADGLDVTADMYPYNAFCTTMTSLLPAWALEGGFPAMVARMRDPQTRAQIAAFMAREAEDGQPGYWQGTLISGCERLPEIEGRDLQSLADERGRDPVDAALDILLESGGEASMVQFAMNEDNVEMGLRVPYIMIGSDGEGRSREGSTSIGKPHPRNYGTFPRVLGHYTRERGLFPLEIAVSKMTGLTAQKFGLKDRGLLRPGCAADVTILDPQTVIDRATFRDPHQYAEGIAYVLVNGKPVIWQGQHTRALPGSVLSR